MRALHFSGKQHALDFAMIPQHSIFKLLELLYGIGRKFTHGTHHILLLSIPSLQSGTGYLPGG